MSLHLKCDGVCVKMFVPIILVVTKTKTSTYNEAAFNYWPITSFSENQTNHRYDVNISGATFPYINIKNQHRRTCVQLLR